MITNEGKELIAKFLLGQVPTFATHISLGCGARPAIDLPRTVTARKVLGNVATLTSPEHGYRIGDLVSVTIDTNTYNGVYKIIDITKDTISYQIEHPNNSNVAASGNIRLATNSKRHMDFEMIRVPISSRGYVNEGGVTKIAFAAEMPTTERFLVTEAGLWSAGSNSNALNSDSKQLYTFGQLEGWKYHHGGTIEDVPLQAFLAASPPDIDKGLVGKVFIAPSDTPVMTNASRANRYEPGRYMSHTIMLRGDSSKINTSNASSRHGILSLDGSFVHEHIHLDTASIDFSANNPSDELKLAFSVVSRVAANPVTPQKTRVYVEFLHSESSNASGYARMFGEVNADDLFENRYVVLTKKLSELIVSGDFSWPKVRVVRIFASCYDGAGALDSEHYVSLDSMRFENVSSPNPTYAMSGYAIFNDGSTVSPKPIYKIPNTSNYIEFRANIGVI